MNIFSSITIFNKFYTKIEKLYLYTCEWNYRPDHCMYMSVCDGAKKNGIKMLHGCRKAFTTDKQPSFKVVYDIYKDVRVKNFFLCLSFPAYFHLIIEKMFSFFCSLS